MLSLLRNKYGSLAIISCIIGLATAVNLKPDNASFCPGSTAIFFCSTTMGSLLWETSNTTANHIFNNPAQSPSMLGIFLLQLDGISPTSGTVKAVNSTAVVNDVLLSYDGISLKCSEYADLSIFSETILRVKGPPPAPAVNPITVVDESSINSTLLISWSQSNCAVQYMVTIIINSSDDRVYPNITTSNTNTTVTLPTGVEFCVTLVAVDSIGRRGPDTTPVCYQSTSVSSEVSTTMYTASDTGTIHTTFKAGTLINTLTLTPSPTVTQSPVMMGGINVAAAVAIPVVLVLLLVIGVVVVVVDVNYLCYHKRQGHSSDMPLQRTKRVQVFSRECGANMWKIEYVTCWKEDNRSVKKHFENSGYTAHGEPVDVQVTSDEETIPVTVQSITTGWSVERLQDSKVEVGNHTTDENKPLFTTTTYTASPSQTTASPKDDMCVSVTINGGQTPHIVTVERKPSKRCVCQVFYHWEGINCWKMTFAFFSEHLLDEVQQLYQDIQNGPKVDFNLCYEACDIHLFTDCKTSMWHIMEGSKSRQVSRAAVEGYTGEGEPPCIVMTIKPKSDKTKPPDLTLPVTLTGVREPNNIIVIERTAEDPTGLCVCQVFYHKEDSNNWTVILAFCQKNKFDKMKEFYQDANIGTAIDIDFKPTSPHIAPSIRKVTEGWTLVPDNQLKQVSRVAVEGYTGEGEPPCIVMTLRAATNKTMSIDANFTVTLDGVQPPNTITITRSPDAANFQTQASTDVDDSLTRSYDIIDSDTETGQFNLFSNSNPPFMRRI